MMALYPVGDENDRAHQQFYTAYTSSLDEAYNEGLYADVATYKCSDPDRPSVTVM